MSEPTIHDIARAACRAAISLASDPSMKHYSTDTVVLQAVVVASFEHFARAVARPEPTS